MNAPHPITIACVPEPDAALGDALVQLQKDVWGSEPDDVLPSWRFVVTPRTGGELFVAHAGDELVGFALCSLGIEGHETYLHLDLLGVHPAHRHRGVGEQLVRAIVGARREYFVIRMRWTFDPLEGANANLSIAKLGARGIRYFRNLYGISTGSDGLDDRSDRLLVQLSLAPGREFTSMREPRPTLVLELGGVLPTEPPARLALALPADYARLRASNPTAARAVREWSGRVLESLFAAGFRITDFERGDDVNHLVAERVPRVAPWREERLAAAERARAEARELDIDDESVRVLARQVAAYLNEGEAERHRWAWMLLLTEFLHHRPEATWSILLGTLPLVASNEGAFEAIAEGLLQGLIAEEGTRFVGRIEELARRDPYFARIVRLVERGSTPDDIWSRIEAVRHHVW